MEVTINNNLIEVEEDDGRTYVINGQNIVDEGGIPGVEYYAPGAQVQPLQVTTPVKVTDWTIMVRFNDQRWWQFYLNQVTNQPTWTNNLAGANNAVTALKAALIVSGGGGGAVTSVNGQTGAVTLDATDVGADPAGSAAAAEANANAYTDIQVSAEAEKRYFNQQRLKVLLVFTEPVLLSNIVGGSVHQGVTLTTNQGVVLIAGNGPTVNGPYTPGNTGGSATRSTDFGEFNGYNEVVQSSYVCSSGDYAGTTWISPNAIIAAGGTLGSDPVTFEQLPVAAKLFTQTGHGFSAGDLLYLASANTYAKARANSESTSDVVLYVLSVVDANTFYGVYPGNTVPATGLTAGNYFLSPSTAGAKVTTNTTTVGEVSAPVGVALNSTTFLFKPERPLLITAPPAATYLMYDALLNQSGTDDPVATVLQNTLGGTVVWTRNGVGEYTATLAGAFGVNVTMILCNGILELGGAQSKAHAACNDDDSISVQTESSFDTPADSQLNNWAISVSVKQ